MNQNSVRKSVILLFILVLVCACSGKTGKTIQREEAVLARPTALVDAGAGPVWIEFQGDSIIQISAPENAALKPFTPWPSAEHAAGMVQWEEGLAIAVNRGGFLLARSRGVPNAGQDGAAPNAGDGDVSRVGLELYFLTEKEFAPLYTMNGAFIFQNKPVFLIYRNDFFGTQENPPPVSRFFTINDDKTGLEPIDIPVFSEFSGEKGWDIEELFNIDESFWYFKAILKGNEADGVNYVRTERLSNTGGEKISPGTYMSAARLAAREKAGVEDESGDISEAAPPLPPGLPSLPENFVYTLHSRIGSVYITAWEERENWNTGAAGLLFTPAPQL
ncbi:MAG: hypothetical protein LBJ35_06420 [Spirochaetaceae bacterium]|jgi:hypothetical protein|nr:hypothetical protein [Spirochaetaceae bacterium]